MTNKRSNLIQIFLQLLLASLTAGLALLTLSLFAKSGKKKDTGTPKAKKKKSPKADPPEEPVPQQQLGDTPTVPWEMPTPEEKAETQPVRDTLEKAISHVDSPKKAGKVADQLENLAAGVKSDELEQAAKPDKSGDQLAQSAQAVKESTKKTPPVEKASNAIAQTAEEIATTTGRDREALAQAAQEVLNPEQQGQPVELHKSQREYLRKAIIKRMKPLDALDAELFLAINHLPHNRLLNGFFYFFTFTFRGGAAWYFLMSIALLFNRRLSWPVILRTTLPLAVATTIVEHPIKAFFRRRRPFIGIIQAIVIGKKPGSWSFPSGHSAAAFAGARLLSKGFPGLRGWLYTLAGCVAFSRIYLGDHYPGDVFSGAFSGLLLAEVAQSLQNAAVRLGKRR